jgi:hypothetical protein
MLNALSVDEATSKFFQYFEAGGVYDTDGTLSSRQGKAKALALPF